MKKFLGILAVSLVALGVFAGDSYNFFYISDPHLQDASSYNTDPAIGKVSTKDYYRPTRYKAVFDSMLRRMASLRNKDSMMIVSGGDYIEGCCRNATDHAYQLTKQIAWLKRYIKLPFLMCVGNHDAVGAGGQEGFDAVVPPMMEEDFGFAPGFCDEAEFAWMEHGDLFVLLNSYGSGHNSQTTHPFLRSALAAFPNSRYVIVINHPNSMSQSFINDLDGRPTIFLGGHSHENKISRYDQNGQQASELILSTFFSAKARFGSKTTTQPTTQTLPLKSFVQYRSGTGFARLLISDTGVVAELYSTVPSSAPIRIRML